VSGSFDIEYAPALETLSFPVLQTVQFISIFHTGLTSLDLPDVASISEYTYIEDNPALPTCEVQPLAAFAGSGVDVSIGSNDDVATCP
jgi:hypothetical protein